MLDQAPCVGVAKEEWENTLVILRGGSHHFNKAPAHGAPIARGAIRDDRSRSVSIRETQLKSARNQRSRAVGIESVRASEGTSAPTTVNISR